MMIKAKEEMVLEDSPEAASVQTVTGWVSRLGHFFGPGEQGERTARYDGSTHKKCACGAITTKGGWIKCEACRAKEASEKFKTLKREKWDGKTPLALYDGDAYFFSIDDIDQYCEDNDAKPESLRLVLCYPVKPSEVNANDMFCDQLPEDGEVEDADILAAVDALNAAIRKAGPFSWYPGNVAVTL